MSLEELVIEVPIGNKTTQLVIRDNRDNKRQNPPDLNRLLSLLRLNIHTPYFLESTRVVGEIDSGFLFEYLRRNFVPLNTKALIHMLANGEDPNISWINDGVHKQYSEDETLETILSESSPDYIVLLDPRIKKGYNPLTHVVVTREIIERVRNSLNPYLKDLYEQNKSFKTVIANGKLLNTTPFLVGAILRNENGNYVFRVYVKKNPRDPDESVPEIWYRDFPLSAIGLDTIPESLETRVDTSIVEEKNDTAKTLPLPKGTEQDGFQEVEEYNQQNLGEGFDKLPLKFFYYPKPVLPKGTKKVLSSQENKRKFRRQDYGEKQLELMDRLAYMLYNQEKVSVLYRDKTGKLFVDQNYLDLDTLAAYVSQLTGVSISSTTLRKRIKDYADKHNLEFKDRKELWQKAREEGILSTKKVLESGVELLYIFHPELNYEDLIDRTVAQSLRESQEHYAREFGQILEEVKLELRSKELERILNEEGSDKYLSSKEAWESLFDRVNNYDDFVSERFLRGYLSNEEGKGLTLQFFDQNGEKLEPQYREPEIIVRGAILPKKSREFLRDVFATMQETRADYGVPNN